MHRSQFIAALVAALVSFGLLLMPTDGLAAAAQGCGGCHPDFAKVLPKGHPPAKGSNLAACLTCHKPATAVKKGDKPAKNGFAAALHAKHGSVDCATCHVVRAKGKPGVAGGKVVLVAAPADLDLLKKSMSSEQAGYTAGLHAKARVSCNGCHDGTPKAGDEVANDRCTACHALEPLQKKTEPAQFHDRNPHKSHLGDIACNVCHKGHEPAVVYCLDCHPKFQMKIMGGAKR